jgi:hypothetical protein
MNVFKAVAVFLAQVILIVLRHKPDVMTIISAIRMVWALLAVMIANVKLLHFVMIKTNAFLTDNMLHVIVLMIV